MARAAPERRPHVSDEKCNDRRNAKKALGDVHFDLKPYRDVHVEPSGPGAPQTHKVAVLAPVERISRRLQDHRLAFRVTYRFWRIPCPSCRHGRPLKAATLGRGQERPCCKHGQRVVQRGVAGNGFTGAESGSLLEASLRTESVAPICLFANCSRIRVLTIIHIKVHIHVRMGRAEEPRQS